MMNPVKPVYQGLKEMFSSDLSKSKKTAAVLMLGATAISPSAAMVLGVASAAISFNKLCEQNKIVNSETATEEEKKQAEEKQADAFTSLVMSTGLMTPYSGGLAVMGISSLLHLYENEPENQEIASALQEAEEEPNETQEV